MKIKQKVRVYIMTRCCQHQLKHVCIYPRYTRRNTLLSPAIAVSRQVETLCAKVPLPYCYGEITLAAQ